MKAHMEAVRGVTGGTDKLSVSQATDKLRNTKVSAMYTYAINLMDDAYDENTYYPVTVSSTNQNAVLSDFTTQFIEVAIRSSLQTDAGSYTKWGKHPSTDSNGNHGSVFFKKVRFNYNGWGAVNVNAYIEANEHNFDDGKSPAYIDQLVANEGILLWLRGGANYKHIEINIPNLVLTLHTDSFKDRFGHSIAPTKTEPSDFYYLELFVKGSKIEYQNSTTAKVIDLPSRNFTDHGIIYAGDANNLVDTGIWNNHGGLDNLPLQGVWGVLVVYASNFGKDYIKQEWTSVNDGATYSRIKNADGWLPWTKLGG